MSMEYRHGVSLRMDADAEKTRTVEHIISTSGRDRYRTVLNQEAWNLEHYNANPIVGYNHNVYGGALCFPDDPDNVIGQGYAYNEIDEAGNARLIGRATYELGDENPLAEKVFRKLLRGTLRATSVGFIPSGGAYGKGAEAAGMENETWYFASQELLEFSVVNIPGNPEAVGRVFRNQTAHALMFVRQAFGEGYSFSDIERMTVGDVLKALDDPKRINESFKDFTQELSPKLEAGLEPLDDGSVVTKDIILSAEEIAVLAFTSL